MRLKKYKKAVWLLVVVNLCVACVSDDEIVYSDIPVAVSQQDDTTVDIDLAIANAEAEVNGILPNAQLAFFSFTGQCQKLADFQGEVLLYFTQAKWRLFGQRINVARATLDTTQGLMAVTIKDETEHYPNTETLAFEGQSTSKIAAVVTDYLSSINRCDGTIVLNRSSTEGPWGVRCGPPDQVFIHCIEIDASTGQVIDLHR